MSVTMNEMVDAKPFSAESGLSRLVFLWGHIEISVASPIH